jgi:hypothetical protein
VFILFNFNISWPCSSCMLSHSFMAMAASEERRGERSYTSEEYLGRTLMQGFSNCYNSYP